MRWYFKLVELENLSLFLYYNPSRGPVSSSRILGARATAGGSSVHKLPKKSACRDKCTKLIKQKQKQCQTFFEAARLTTTWPAGFWKCVFKMSVLRFMAEWHYAGLSSALLCFFSNVAQNKKNPTERNRKYRRNDTTAERWMKVTKERTWRLWEHNMLERMANLCQWWLMKLISNTRSQGG